MAKDKKSFLVYCDLIHTVKKMKKEDAGELFLHLLEYTNDLNPVTENAIVELVFEPIKQQLKRDLKAYETSIEEKSLSGRLGNLKRWNNDLFLKVELKEISLDEAENIAKHRKASHTDSLPSHTFAKIAVTDTVNDTVTVTVKDIKEESNKRKPKTVFTPPLEFEVVDYFKENGYSEQSAKKAFNYYNIAEWSDSKGNKIKNWKQKMISVWFKDENKINIQKNNWISPA